MKEKEILRIINTLAAYYASDKLLYSIRFENSQNYMELNVVMSPTLYEVYQEDWQDFNLQMSENNGRLTLYCYILK